MALFTISTRDLTDWMRCAGTPSSNSSRINHQTEQFHKLCALDTHTHLLRIRGLESAMLLSILIAAVLAYFTWDLACLELNVRTARALRVPVVRIPFGGNNYIWVIFQPLIWNILHRLPFPWDSYPNFLRFSHRNWHFLEKSQPTTAFGPVWALVSPAGISLYFSEPECIEAIYSRWRDFVRPVKNYRKSILQSSKIHL